jgi:hypothetical protein
VLIIFSSNGNGSRIQVGYSEGLQQKAHPSGWPFRQNTRMAKLHPPKVRVTAAKSGALAIILTFLTGGMRLLSAQNAEPDRYPVVQARFQRQLDALQWRYSTAWNRNWGQTSVRFSDRRNTNLFMFNGLPQNIQEEHRLDLHAAVPVSNSWRALVHGYQFTFSAGDVAQWWVAGGLEHTMKNGTAASVSGGLISDKRNGVTDQGAYVRAAYATGSTDWNGILIQPAVRIEAGAIHPRSLLSARAETPVHFSDERFLIEGRVFSSLDIRESYQAINFLNRNVRDAIESIQTDTAGAYAFTSFNLGRGWSSTLETDMRQVRRTYDYRKLIEEDDRLFFDTGFFSRRIDNRFTMRKQWNSFFAESGASYGVSGDEAELKNAGDLPEDQVIRRKEILDNSVYFQSRTSVFTTFGQNTSGKHRWSVRAQAGILRHDTPDANPDDRDEQQLLIAADASRHLFDVLTISATFSAERIRNVYLFARRSAENNDRHSIRLSPTATWTPVPSVVFNQTLLLRANYTTYQFPLATPGVTDQSAREYGHRSDLTWKMDRDYAVTLSAARNELRIGRLFWKTFKETPLDTLVSWDVSAGVTRYFAKGWATFGLRWFSKWDFMPMAVNQLQLPDGQSPVVRAPGRLITRQFGPTIDIRMPFETKHELYVRGWYQIQRIRQQLYADYPEAFAADFQRNETSFPRRIFPNVEMTARLKF